MLLYVDITFLVLGIPIQRPAYPIFSYFRILALSQNTNSVHPTLHLQSNQLDMVIIFASRYYNFLCVTITNVVITEMQTQMNKVLITVWRQKVGKRVIYVCINSKGVYMCIKYTRYRLHTTWIFACKCACLSSFK